MFARLVASLLSGETSNLVGRVRTAAISYLIAGLVALCGIIFLIGAGYIAAAQRWGAFEAALGFGVGFLVLSGIIWIGYKIAARARARRVARRREADIKALAGTAAITLLPSLLARKSGLGVLLLPLAAVAAYMIYKENRDAPDDEDD